MVSVKPIDALLTAITEFESVRSSALMVRVVGGGAAAVEVALALAWRWRESTAGGSPSLPRPRCWMAFRRGYAALALQACKRLGVSVLEKSPVRQIDPTRLRLENGNLVETQLTVLATGYAPASLLDKALFSKSDNGSVAVDAQLRCLRYPTIFAAGDCADVAGLKLPKSGVYAVRHGPLLAANLLAAIHDQPLQNYRHNPTH